VVVIRQAEHADARRGQVECRRTAEAACAHHQDARGRQLALPGDADFIQQDVPAVPAQCLGRKFGRVWDIAVTA